MDRRTASSFKTARRGAVSASIATLLLLPMSSALGASPKEADETLRVQTEVVKLANAICKDPPTYGLMLTGQGKISGKLSIPKAIKAIGADGTISASLSGRATYWRGVQQDQAAAAHTARNSCAMSATRLLFRDLEYTSLVSGRRIPAPINYTRLLSNNTTQTTTEVASPTQTVSGNGNITVGGNLSVGTSVAAPTYRALGGSCESSAWIPVEVTELSKLSPADLRTRVRAIGETLRASQKDFDKRRSQIFQSPQYRQEDIATLNEDTVQKMDADHLRDKAQTAITEMIERTGGHMPHRPSDGLTLEGQDVFCGQLNTTHGLSDLADYLDMLAASLPA